MILQCDLGLTRNTHRHTHTHTHTEPLQTPFIVFGAPSAFLLVPSGCLHDCSVLCPPEDVLTLQVCVISPGKELMS